MASSSIGKWSAQASLDARGFVTGVETMAKKTKEAEKSMSSFMGASISGPFGMRLGFGNLAEAVGINSLMGAFDKLNETLESGLELGFLNDQLGTSIEWLSSLQTVASENSVNAQQFSAAMQRVQQVLGQAVIGSEEAVETFSRLGLSVEQLQGQGFEQMFMQVATSLTNISDRSVRARTAMELFGRQGAGNMLRFLSNIEGSLEDVRARGGYITAGDIARFQQLDDAIDRMTTRWNQTWRDFLSNVGPSVTVALDAMNESVRTLGDIWRFYVNNLSEAIGDVQYGTANINNSAAVAQQLGQQPGGVNVPMINLGGTGFALGMATFGAVLPAATEAARQFANAQIEAARQAEMAMQRLRAFVEEARSPVERFDMAVRQVLTAGLSQSQTAFLLGQRVQDLLDTIPSGQLSGAALAGSVEDANITGEAIARRLEGGPMDRMRQALEVANQQRQRLIDLGRELLADRSGNLKDILAIGGAG